MWFYEEVHSKRLIFSVACLVTFTVLQKTFLDAIQFMLVCLSGHPVVAFDGFIYAIINFDVAKFYIVYGACCVGFSIAHIRFYTVQVFVYKTRFEAVRKFLSWRYLLHLIAMSAMGMFSTMCFLNLFGSDGNNSVFRLIFGTSSRHGYLFVLFHGVWSGMLYSWRYFNNDWNVLSFKFPQDSIVMQLRNKFVTIIADSMFQILQFLHWYYILCIVLDLIMIYFYPDFSISFSSTLLSISIIPPFISAFVTGTLTYISWNFYIHLFNVIITKRYEFTIEPILPGDKDKILNKCLEATDMKVLKYLAFFDMRWLVQFAPKRAKLFFTLSQPGGHPHHWNNLTKVCFALLSELIESLRKLSVPKSAQVIEPIITNGANSCLMHSQTMRPLTSSFIQSPDAQYVTPAQQSMFRNLPRVGQNFNRKKPIFKYLFEDLPNSDAYKVFSSCQLHIWIVEALGFFVNVSYNEVSNGVVLQSMPKILTTLIDLKFADEKLPIGVMSIRNPKDSKFHQNAVLQRKMLRSAIESALYRIVLILKTDIRAVCVEDEYKMCLEKYLKFQQ